MILDFIQSFGGIALTILALLGFVGLMSEL